MRYAPRYGPVITRQEVDRKRAEKVPHVFHDGGRVSVAAKDCVIRALSIYTGEPYSEICEYAQLLLNENGQRSLSWHFRRKGLPHGLTQRLFLDYGLHMVHQSFRCNLPIDKAYAVHGDCIVHIRGHVVCIKNGKTCDTFDSTHTWKGNIKLTDEVWVAK